MSRITLKDQLAGVEFVSKRRAGNNTVEYTTKEGERRMRLHTTDIVTWRPDGSIVLTSGGWHTLTTKERINSVLDTHQVYQDKGRWYLGPVRNWDKSAWVPFRDGMVIRPDGTTEEPHV